MKIFTTLIIIISFFNLSYSQVFPIENIMINGEDSVRINYTILSDGYTAAQLPTFVTDAQNITTALFNKSPFLEYENFFNVYGIKVPSNESGVDHPGTATDITETLPVIDVDNYFGSTFDYYNIHRLLVSTNTAAITSVIASNFPGSDQVLILANSTEYGGAGGNYATTSLHANAAEIAIHEIGHSFGYLADEYWAGLFYAEEKANMTANSDPVTVKWSEWVGINNTGVYAYGPSGDPSNWFRPHQFCEMQILGQQFCSVCKETLIDKIYSLTDPIDTKAPTSTSVDYIGTTINFSVALVLPNPNTLKVEWTMDGSPIGTGADNIDINAIDLPLALNNLVVNVTDTTLLSKSYAPASGYNFSVNWAVNNTLLPLDLLSFDAKRIKEGVKLNWQTASEINLDIFELEKSKDGKLFKKIQDISPNNSTQLNDYSTIDLEPYQGFNYYRLKIINDDNSFEYSPIRLVSIEQKFTFKMYPNPAQDYIHIEHSQNALPNNFTFEIFNIEGKLIKSDNLNKTLGKDVTKIDIENLDKGIYFLVIKRNDFVQKINFVKE